MDRVLIVVAFVVFWILMIALIFWGWRGRQNRQADRIGTFPEVPSDIGSTVLEPSTGLYVGSTIAPSWQDRIAVGDIGHRATGELSRHQHGILLERTGESTIWIPEESIRAIRTERGLAGKVMSKDGLLVIRWELPTGTEIDTGFRADDKFVYPSWVDTDTNTDSGSSAGTDDSKETPRVSSAVLVLEDGRTFRGTTFGAEGRTLGEAVFCTGMTGYQETLTDPSYHRQIVVATAPQIGNTGWNQADGEASSASDPNKIWVAGYVVRDPARLPSSWRSTGTLQDELEKQNVVGIAGIDTRALVRHLRTRGSMRAGVFSGDALGSKDEMLEQVLGQPSMLGADLASEVTTASSYTIEPASDTRFTVVAVDLGIKTNTPRMLAERGVRVHVVPSTTSIEQILELNPDGVFLSNGPGDPATADSSVALTRGVLERNLPLFGICFGNQILGRALGRSTYKMKFGHRGMNIPVVEHTTGRIAITAQNHGFALEGEAGEEFDTDFGRARVSHTCANDGTVEGVELLSGRAFSVQYHPEAAAGPHDAAYLFDRFTSVLQEKK